MRTTASRLAASVLLAGSVLLGYALPARASPAPNVLLIIGDDQAWTDFGFMGHPVIATPHIDALARQGVILRWPAVVAPARHETPVSSVDLAPTILAAAGAEPAPGMTGVNLLEIARGGPVDRAAIFGEGYAHDIVDVDDPSKSLLYRWCIEGRFKLILTYDGQVGRNGAMHPQTASPVELYDLEADPFETENVAGAHPEIVARLAERIGVWPARAEPRILPGPTLDGVH